MPHFGFSKVRTPLTPLAPAPLALGPDPALLLRPCGVMHTNLIVQSTLSDGEQLPRRPPHVN